MTPDEAEAGGIVAAAGNSPTYWKGPRMPKPVPICACAPALTCGPPKPNRPNQPNGASLPSCCWKLKHKPAWMGLVVEEVTVTSVVLVVPGTVTV